MRNTKYAILLFIPLLFSKYLSGQTSNKIVNGEKHVIYSELIGEEKEYWIHLPRDYANCKDKYPVLYITDGSEHFHLAAGTTEFMSSQYVIPKMIVVAILHNDRNHDLTPTHSLTNLEGFESNAAEVSGGGVELLQFIVQDLIPEIESEFRTGPYRILAGHSLGGLFSVYAFLNQNQLFDAFIAMDPALPWDNQYCERLLINSANTLSNRSSKLYISSAHNAPDGKPDKSPFRLSQNSFSEALKSREITNTKHEYFETQNHLTVPYASLYAGLTYAFSDYYILESPEFRLELPFIEDFYKKQAEIFGTATKPPERLIEMFGKYYLLDKNDFCKSIPFFELNTINYPYSCKSFEYLAKAYQASGNTEEAISNFKKVQELCPGNEEIKLLLIELESKRRE